MKTFEKLNKEELADIELENESGFFRMKENEEGEVTVELENKEGKKLVLNHILPESWKMVNAESTTKVDPVQKEIWINTNEASVWGWQYFLTILHEIGHAVISESNDEQKEAYGKFEDMCHKHSELKTNPELMDSFNVLHSAIERDAWAYAIRRFRELAENLNMDTTVIFSSSEDIKEHVHDWLFSYKEWGMGDIKNMNITEEEKEKLLKNISGLYTHRDGR